MGVSGIIFFLACLRSVIQPPLYRETLTLLLNPEFLAVPTTSLSEGGQRPYVPPEFRDFQTIIELLESYEVIAAALPTIKQNFPDEEYSTLRKQLTIKHLPRSEIIEVSFQATSPKKVEQVLQALSEAYIAYARKTSLRSIDQATTLVEEQLPTVQTKVEQLQENLESFRQNHNFYEPEQLSQQLGQQLSESISKMRDVDLSIRSSEALLDELTQRLQVDENLATEDRAALYLILLESLESDEQGRSQLGLAALSSLNEDIEDPSGVVRLDNILNLLNTKNDLIALAQQKAALDKVSQEVNEDIRALAYIDRQYTDLQRNLQVSTNSLNRLLSAREGLQIERAKQVPSWEIISDVKEPDQPVSSIPRTIVLGLFAGILVGSGAVLIADQFDEAYRSIEELEGDLDLPVLLRVEHPQKQSKLQKKAYLSTNFQYFHGLLEDFRLLEINLKLLNPDKHLSSIIISSVDQAETSLVAEHLALAFSQSDQRVLLIETDLQGSTQTTLTAEGGINLADQLASTDAIAPTAAVGLTDNLSLLPAGSLGKSTVELLSASSLKPLLEKLQTQYDVMVIDAPPIQNSAEARLIASQSNGLILVVELRRNKQTAIRRLIHELKQCRIDILGLVVIKPTPTLTAWLKRG